MHAVCNKGTSSYWVNFTRPQLLNEDQFFSTVFHFFKFKLVEQDGSVVTHHTYVREMRHSNFARATAILTNLITASIDVRIVNRLHSERFL